jgi:fucose permease
MTNRRNVAIVSFVAFVAMGITSSVLGPTLPNIAAALALPIEDAGILRAAQQIGMFGATLAGGYVLNRFSPRSVLVPGLILMAAGLILTINTGNLNVALVAMLLVGIGSGLLNLGANVAIVALYESNASAVLAALHTFFGLGLFGGPLIAEQVLRQPENWRTAYLVPAIASVILAIAFALIHMDSPRPAETTSPDQSGARRAIRWLPLLPLTLLLFTYNGAGNGIGDWIATHLQLVARAPADSAAQVTSLYGLALTAGRAISIVVLSRFGNMRVMAVAVGISIVGAALILLAGAQTGAVAVGVALVGLGFSPVYPTVIAIAGQQQPENRGAVTGIVAGIASLGGIVVPVIQGWVGAGQSGGMVVTLASALIMAASLFVIHLMSNGEPQPVAAVEGRRSS